MHVETHDFTQGSIPRNILSLALPMTAAQLINILYNIVDRMYIGRIPGEGRLALTGLGLCLPIISILIGFANLCGSGGGAPVCLHPGPRGTPEAPQRKGKTLSPPPLLHLVFGLALTVLCLLLQRSILYLFGASDVTYPYASDYLSIYLLGTLFVMVGLGMNPFINAQGFGRMGMGTVALGAVVNIVLDPIFIFLLHMGVKGAALATVISQGCTAVWVLLFLTGKRTELRLRLSDLPLSRARVGRILGLGSSGFAMSLTNSLVQVLCNATLKIYGGDLYVGVMTVINSIREVISMPISGITQGCQPVLSYNYGAGRPDRVRQGIRFTAGVTMVYSVIVWVLTLAVPGLLIRIFNDDPLLLADGIPAFRIYFATFAFMSFQFIGQSVFVSLGRSRNAVFFSLLRKAFIVAPLTLLLPWLGLGVNGVFLAEPISNVVGGLACILTMYFTVYRSLRAQP